MIFQVVQKLKMLKMELRKLNSQHFRNVISEAEEVKIVLLEAQKILQEDPLDFSFRQAETQLAVKYKQISYFVENFLQQRSKVTWLRLGDDNTKYFYSIIRQRNL